jgi:hypothetical protein
VLAVAFGIGVSGTAWADDADNVKSAIETYWTSLTVTKNSATEVTVTGNETTSTQLVINDSGNVTINWNANITGSYPGRPFIY